VLNLCEKKQSLCVFPHILYPILSVKTDSYCRYIFCYLSLMKWEEVNMNEKTIKYSVSCEGIGLHSGKRSSVFFHPAPAGWGIVFVKKVRNRLIYIKAESKNVVSTEFATNLGLNGEKIGTVEHVLAAIRGLEIDNILVEVQGDEIPVMDGSAYPFVELLLSAGFQLSDKPRKRYLLKKNIMWGDFNKWIKAYPAKGFKVDYIINFPHTSIGQQIFFYCHSLDSFNRDISRARTFGFLKDVFKLKEVGLALGGSLENAVVFDEKGVLNSEGLRFEDEPVRHKILDFIGDISLIGMPIEGYFQVFCSGHAFNSSFVKYLLKNRHEFLETISFNPDQKKERIQSVQVSVCAN